MQHSKQLYKKFERQSMQKTTFDHALKIMQRDGKRQEAMGNPQEPFFLKTYFRGALGALLLATVLLWAANCRAGDIKLAWDASLDPVTGYTVYYGEQSVLANPSAATAQNVGNVVQYTATGLTAGKKYYFALKASSASGQSVFSNEASGTEPAATTTTTSVTTTTTVQPTTTTTSVRPTTTTTSIFTDSDHDGIANTADNCPNTYNPQQLDADDDGIGDVCDTTPGCGGCGQAVCEVSAAEAQQAAAEQSGDADQDGIADDADNCPEVYNIEQFDADDNGMGDCCDPSPGCGESGQSSCDTNCAP